MSLYVNTDTPRTNKCNKSICVWVVSCSGSEIPDLFYIARCPGSSRRTYINMTIISGNYIKIKCGVPFKMCHVQLSSMTPSMLLIRRDAKNRVMVGWGGWGRYDVYGWIRVQAARNVRVAPVISTTDQSYPRISNITSWQIFYFPYQPHPHTQARVKVCLRLSNILSDSIRYPRVNIIVFSNWHFLYLLLALVCLRSRWSS